MKNSIRTTEFRRIMEYTDTSKIVSTLMYDPDTDGCILDDWEDEIEDGFYKTFGKISTLLPDDFRYMDELRAIIYDMANVHDDIYFHLGMLYGFNLYQNFCAGYHRNKLDQYPEIVNKAKSDCSDKDFLNYLLKQIKEYVHKTENVSK